jgi:hypothetical protein
MVELYRRLNAWREAGRPGNKIPDELWSAAVENARAAGVRPTAMALGLDAGKLRKLLRGATLAPAKAPGSSSGPPPAAQESPRFLELPRDLPPPPATAPASIELAFPDGRKITLRGMRHETVVALFQTFWTVER